MVWIDHQAAAGNVRGGVLANPRPPVLDSGQKWIDHLLSSWIRMWRLIQSSEKERKKQREEVYVWVDAEW